ncbi:MAG: MFS transporter, partial [Candidatus Woesearchaeota archaeon]
MSKDFININLKDYEKNIKKLTIIQALRWTLFIMPVIIPFYQLYNLSMNQIFLIQTFYSFSLLLFEIPSGYFSDYLGRKKTLIIGTFFSFIGFLLYSFSYSFFGFVISEIILGIGSSFISGTDSAFLYENLKKLKKEKDYKKVEGKISFYCSFSEAISGFLAGFFALISLRFNFYIETIFVFIAFLISLTLYEDSSEIKKNKSKNKKELSLSKNLYNHYLEIKKSFNYAFNLKKEIKYVLFFSGFLATSTLIMTWLIQTYFQLLKIPIEFFGILWAIYNLSLGFFSLFSHNFEKFFGFKNSLLIFFLIIFFCSFSLS